MSQTAAMWLNVVFLVAGGIAAGSYYLGTSPDVATMIKGNALNIALVIAAINVVFHAFAAPSSLGGPVYKLLKRS